MERARFYRLNDDHSVSPIEGPDPLMEWAREFEKHRRVALTQLAPGISVSTVFLGLNHRFWGDGPPLVFETMTLTDYMDGEMTRSSTWDEAMKDHEAAVAKARESLEERLSPELREALKALDALPDEQIDTSDIPEVTDWTGAVRGRFRKRRDD